MFFALAPVGADSLDRTSSLISFSESSDYVSIFADIYRFGNSNGLLPVIRSITIA